MSCPLVMDEAVDRAFLGGRCGAAVAPWTAPPSGVPWSNHALLAALTLFSFSFLLSPPPELPPPVLVRDAYSDLKEPIKDLPASLPIEPDRLRGFLPDSPVKQQSFYVVNNQDFILVG